MNIRSALTAPFRLSFIDLAAALAIAVLAFALVVGPVTGQDASPSVEPSVAADATPEPASTTEHWLRRKHLLHTPPRTSSWPS